MPPAYMKFRTYTECFPGDGDVYRRVSYEMPAVFWLSARCRGKSMTPCKTLDPSDLALRLGNGPAHRDVDLEFRAACTRWLLS